MVLQRDSGYLWSKIPPTIMQETYQCLQSPATLENEVFSAIWAIFLTQMTIFAGHRRRWRENFADTPERLFQTG
jgi:hypothetical protein